MYAAWKRNFIKSFIKSGFEKKKNHHFMYSEGMLMGGLKWREYCRTFIHRVDLPDCDLECLEEECVGQEEILSSTDTLWISWVTVFVSKPKVPPTENTLIGNAGYNFCCVRQPKFICTVHHVRLNGNNSLFSLFLFIKKKSLQLS